MKRVLLVVTLSMCAAAIATAQTVDCGCESGPVPAVWATVNGVNVSELDAATLQRVKAFQQEVIDARKRELDQQINSRLLELEAAKQGITSTELWTREIVNKKAVPTAAEIEAYFNKNRAQIETQAGRSITLEEVREQVREFLAEQKHLETAQIYADKLRTQYAVKKLVDEAPLTRTAADRQKVLATIGTLSIRSADIEDALKPIIYGVQQDVYRTRKNVVDLDINNRLLDAEAKKRGMTTAQLYDAEITKKVQPTTEAQALAFFNENKARLSGEFATLKPQIIKYLDEQATEAAGIAFADQLRAAAQIRYFLEPPVAPIYDIPATGHAAKGPATAKVTLTVFTDYQCPTCALAHPDIQRIASEYKDRVRIVVYNYPLDMHADARKAAEAAEAAREQGKFWEYVDLLYKNQSQLSVAKLKEYATAVGLNRAKFDKALDTGAYKKFVDSDALKGSSIGVNSTPTVFLNGKPIDAFRYDGLKAAVDAALKP